MMFLFSNFYYQTYVSRKRQQQQQKQLQHKKSDNGVYYEKEYLADKTQNGQDVDGDDLRRRGGRQTNGNNNAKWKAASAEY